MYVIVKHARDGCWHNHYKTDPKNGVCIEASCRDTYSCISANIQPCYTDKVQAMEDLRRLRILNPSGNYDICPVIEKD